MGYKKIIISGNLIEEYEYEKAIPPRKPQRYVKKRSPSIRRRIDNVKRLRKTFYRLVRANIDGKANPYLITLTSVDVVSISQAYGRLTEFWSFLRRKVGSNFSYICVPEFQKRGSVHFHCLVWGLPPFMVKNERKSRIISRYWLWGFCDSVLTDGSPKLAGYLAKYMYKSMLDERLLSEKAYSCSRNVMRPVYLKGQVQTSYLSEIIDVDNYAFDIPKSLYIFNTTWLGKCIYKSYIKKNE